MTAAATSDQHNRKGIVYGVLATAMFAAYILTNRYVYVHYDVDVIAYVVTFTLWAGFFALLSLSFNRYKGNLRFINKGTVPVALTGMFAAVGVGLIVLGQKYTTAINASIIATASIIPTILFSKFILKERFTKSQWLWLAGLFIGLYLAIVGFRGLSLNMGDAIILGSAVVLGFTNTYSKVLMKSNSSDYVADVRLVGGGLLFLVLGLVLKGSGVIVLEAGLWPVLGGLFYWLTIKFFYASIQYISPSKAITLINSHPIVTPIVGVLVLSEHYQLTTFIGSVILLVSIYYINRK